MAPSHEDQSKETERDIPFYPESTAPEAQPFVGIPIPSLKPSETDQAIKQEQKRIQETKDHLRKERG